MERVAKLNRLRELAVKKDDKEMIARVDKLIAKEKEVSGRKQEQVQGQPRVTPPAGPVTAGPNDVAGRKGQAGAAELKAGKDAKTDVKEQKAPEPKPEKPK